MPPVAIDYSRILFDGQGRPYWLKADGSKVFLPPLAAMQSSDPRAVEWARRMGVSVDDKGTITNQAAPGASFLRERGHWNAETGQFDQDINLNNIVSTAVGAGLGLGGLNMIGAVGGAAGGGAAQSAAPGAVLPSSTNPLVTSSILGGAGPMTTAMGSQGASQGIGSGISAAANGAANAFANGAGNAGGGIGDFFTDPSNLAGLGGLIASLVGGNNRQPEVDPNLQRQHAMTAERMRRVDPLHQAVTQLAWGRLPISARNGVAPPQMRPLED